MLGPKFFSKRCQELAEKYVKTLPYKVKIFRKRFTYFSITFVTPCKKKKWC